MATTPSEPDPPEDPAEELYGLPREEFVAARDALARQLRSAGAKDQATRVKGLAKPSAASGALNLTARCHPAEVDRLLAAAAELREAQQRAVSGDASWLRQAARRWSEEVDRLGGLAASFLPATPEAQRRLAATLRAVAGDESAAELLRRGVLVADLDPSGFGLAVAGGPEVIATRPRPEAPSREAVEEARRARPRAEAEAEAESAERRAARQAQRAEEARRRAEEAQRGADAADAEAAEALEQARQARLRAARASQEETP